MGWEGANVIFDTWVHPLVMGLEEHLLTMFREDFEFHDAAGPSHHGGHASRGAKEGGQPPIAASGDSPRSISSQMNEEAAVPVVRTDGTIVWLPDAEKELRKIPFFVRGKAKRNTEAYAAERGVARISVETLYEAKAHYAR
jgi:light-independent protochlorophyllide reductase subunit B